jgi:hypothetical protein
VGKRDDRPEARKLGQGGGERDHNAENGDSPSPPLRRPAAIADVDADVARPA